MFHGLRIVSNTLDIDANIVGSIRDSVWIIRILLLCLVSWRSNIAQWWRKLEVKYLVNS